LVNIILIIFKGGVENRVDEKEETVIIKEFIVSIYITFFDLPKGVKWL
jgi:hypothetical protein